MYWIILCMKNIQILTCCRSTSENLFLSFLTAFHLQSTCRYIKPQPNKYLIIAACHFNQNGFSQQSSKTHLLTSDSSVWFHSSCNQVIFLKVTCLMIFMLHHFPLSNFLWVAVLQQSCFSDRLLFYCPLIRYHTCFTFHAGLLANSQNVCNRTNSTLNVKLLSSFFSAC